MIHLIKSGLFIPKSLSQLPMGTLRSHNGDVYKNLAENRLRILSNHFVIILSRPVTYAKRIYVRAEESGPHPSSDRDGRIYRLVVLVLIWSFQVVVVQEQQRNVKKSVIHAQGCCFAN